MTAWRRREPLFLLLVPVALCAGLVTAAEGKQGSLGTGETAKPSEAPSRNTEGLGGDGGAPRSRWLPGVHHRKRAGDAGPGSGAGSELA